MASFKVGARGEGAIAGLLDFVQDRRQREQDISDERRKFGQRLIELGITQKLKEGSTTFNIQTGRFEDSTPTIPTFDDLQPGERATVPIRGGGTRTFVGPPDTAAIQRGLVSKFPLQPKRFDASGRPKELLDDPAILGRLDVPFGKDQSIGADRTNRELLGRLVSAVMRDPNVINSSAFRRVLQTGQLESFLPQFQQLSQASQQRRGTARGPSVSPSTIQSFNAELPDPQDPSLSADGRSTEGAQFQTSDGHIYEIQNGVWVQITKTLIRTTPASESPLQ